MPARNLSRLILIPFGIALLLAGLFFDGGQASSVRQAAPTPTPDRLAQPILPAIPSQADYGAQVYWLSCLPCHGDRGQGLTDEFRAVYPPEDRNCWISGCHGERPYEHGFRLPREIPAVIGPGALQNFPNAAALYAYTRAAMPFWKPGSLTEEETWRVTAFLLRQNGLWTGVGELDAAAAAEIPILRATPPPTPLPAPGRVPVETGGGGGRWALPAASALTLLLILFLILRRKRASSNLDESLE
ncbi:MAG: hypothetical protein B6D40_09050 [Anaerolineae bacterium UTCFX3]|nr:MAG: hypothetical protein B6D40_09050 [Anaerolineae bacterium UTCFX3]